MGAGELNSTYVVYSHWILSSHLGLPLEKRSSHLRIKPKEKAPACDNIVRQLYDLNNNDDSNTDDSDTDDSDTDDSDTGDDIEGHLEACRYSK